MGKAKERNEFLAIGCGKNSSQRNSKPLWQRRKGIFRRAYHIRRLPAAFVGMNPLKSSAGCSTSPGIDLITAEQERSQPLVRQRLYQTRKSRLPSGLVEKNPLHSL